MTSSRSHTMSRTATKYMQRFTRSWFFGALSLATLLTFAAGAARAEDKPVRAAVEEAVAVHSIATAARLCNVITESELTHALSRMDRVHSSQLGAKDQETYRIVRGSDSFRNMVFAAALKKT